MGGSSARTGAVGAPGRVGRGARALATVAAVVLTAAGCGGDDTEVEWPPDPVSTPTATRDAGEVAAVGDILAAYDDFRRVEAGLYADPVPPAEAKPRLTGYLGDPLLTVTLLAVDIMHRRDLVSEGRREWDPVVTDLRLDRDPPVATVRDCLDATGWEITRRGGASASLEGLPSWFAPDRHVLEYRVRYLEDRWLLDESQVERAERC